jgi:hypothetical protein
MNKQRLSCQIVLSCLLITLTKAAYAADEPCKKKEFIFDHYWSPHSSSSILISSRALLNEAEDFVFRAKHAQYSVGGRIATTVLNTVLNCFLVVVNHEVHGHGFRARSLGITISRYSFSLNGGATHYYLQPLLTPYDERLLVTMGGIEANNVLAQQLLFKSFRELSLDRRTYDLLLSAYWDLPGYVLLTHFSDTARNSPGNDISCYIKEINHKHSTNGIDTDKMVQGILVYLCNPVLYISLWTQLDDLFTRKDSFRIPHLKLGHTNYMPLIRMGLTPFGLVYYLENYIGHGNKTFLVSISGGHSPYYTRGYGGIQLQTDELWTYKNYGLDVIGNLWCQPKMQLRINGQIEGENCWDRLMRIHSNQIEDKNYWGGLVGINNKFRFGKLIALNASISYKTAGFIEGIVANSGFIVSAGFSLYH